MKLFKNSLLMMLVGLTLLPICLHAQEKKPEKSREKDFFSLDFNLDYSFALGNYGQTDKSTEKSGYAANGWVALLGFNWLGPKGWGMAVQMALQHNPYKDTAVNMIPWGVSYPLGSNGWWNIYAMAGPAYMRNFGPWELSVKALAGLIISESSNFNVTNPMDSSNVALTGTGWGFGASATFGYRFDKHWGINLNCNYLGGGPRIKKKFSGDPEIVYEIKRTVSTLNAGVGVVYHF